MRMDEGSGRRAQVRREERDGALHKGHTGTLRWMAPEVLGKVSQYTEKVRLLPRCGCLPGSVFWMQSAGQSASVAERFHAERVSRASVVLRGASLATRGT